MIQGADPAALSIPGFDEANEAKIALLFRRGSKSEKTKIDGAVPLSVTEAFHPQKQGNREITHPGLRNAARTYIVRSPFVQYRFA